jgi:hypothetical protein
MRVFISSTCYDLVDLRAELELFFREAGVEAVLSDSLSSEFQTKPDCNSIETCLANVRNCDEFLIILSGRYGPSLGKAGFDDVSATHLEYHEALKHNKPIRMFVRDRLEADYSIWRSNNKNPTLKLSWCKEQEDWKIFGLLQEHRKLTNDSNKKNNWLWFFRDSIELKQRLSLDFKETFARATAAKIAANGRVPFFEILISHKSYNPLTRVLAFELRIRNLGGGFAVNPVFQILASVNSWKLPSIGEREQTNFIIEWAVYNTPIELNTHLSFSILDGHKFADEGKITIHFAPDNPMSFKLTYELKKRSYVGATMEMLIT